MIGSKSDRHGEFMPNRAVRWYPALPLDCGNRVEQEARVAFVEKSG
jgi:hypothetical protein